MTWINKFSVDVKHRTLSELPLLNCVFEMYIIQQILFMGIKFV